jgi:hypothetical protein
MRFFAVCIFVIFLQMSLFASQIKGFVTITNESAHEMWWLRATYNPYSKAIRGIPVDTISRDWCYADEFTAELFSAEQMQTLDGLRFAVETDFGLPSKQFTVLVGAYESCKKEKGLFVLVLEKQQNSKLKIRFLEKIDSQNVILGLTKEDSGFVRVWWCNYCDNFQDLTWDSKEEKFVWKFMEFG